MKKNNLAIILFSIGIATCSGCQRGSEQASNDPLKNAVGESSNKAERPDDSRTDAATGLGHVEHESINGHPFRFEPADFAGAWLSYSHNNVIRVFIMNASGDESVRLKVDSMTVFGAEGAIFSLDPDNVDTAGSVDSFSLENRDLAIAMNLGAKLVMEIGDKTYHAEVPGIRK